MNWVGGRLHQSKRSGHTITAKQKAYFAKARRRMQTGDTAYPPIHLLDFDTDTEWHDDKIPATGQAKQPRSMETGPESRSERCLGQDEFERLFSRDSGESPGGSRGVSGPSRQRKLEEFESVAPLAKRLSDMREGKSGGQRNASERDGPWKSIHRNTERLELSQATSGIPSQADCSTDEYELIRRRLLQRSDWLGTDAARPVKMDFASRGSQEKVARRRELIGTTRDARKKRNRARQHKTSSQEHAFEDRQLPYLPRNDEISIRVGSEIHGTQRTSVAHSRHQSNRTQPEHVKHLPSVSDNGDIRHGFERYDASTKKNSRPVQRRARELPVGVQLGVPTERGVLWTISQEILDTEASPSSDLMLLDHDSDRKQYTNPARSAITEDHQAYKIPRPQRSNVTACESRDMGIRTPPRKFHDVDPDNESQSRGHPSIAKERIAGHTRLPANNEESTQVQPDRLVFHEMPQPIGFSPSCSTLGSRYKYKPSQRSIAAESSEDVEPEYTTDEARAWYNLMDVAPPTSTNSKFMTVGSIHDVKDHISISSGANSSDEDMQDGDSKEHWHRPNKEHHGSSGEHDESRSKSLEDLMSDESYYQCFMEQNSADPSPSVEKDRSAGPRPDSLYDFSPVLPPIQPGLVEDFPKLLVSNTTAQDDDCFPGPSQTDLKPEPDKVVNVEHQEYDLENELWFKFMFAKDLERHAATLPKLFESAELSSSLVNEADLNDDSLSIAANVSSCLGVKAASRPSQHASHNEIDLPSASNQQINTFVLGSDDVDKHTAAATTGDSDLVRSSETAPTEAQATLHEEQAQKDIFRKPSRYHGSGQRNNTLILGPGARASRSNYGASEERTLKRKRDIYDIPISSETDEISEGES